MRKNKSNNTKLILAISGLAISVIGFALRPETRPSPAAAIEPAPITIDIPVVAPKSEDDDLAKILLNPDPIGNPLSKELQNIGTLLDIKDLSMDIDKFRDGSVDLNLGGEQDMQVAAVPEASTLSLLAFGGVALFSRKRRAMK